LQNGSLVYWAVCRQHKRDLLIFNKILAKLTNGRLVYEFMQRELLDSPKRLAAATSLSGLVGGIGWVCMGLSRGPNRHVWLSGSFATVMIGIFGIYRASYSLREGIRNERWPDEAVELLRRSVQHPVWKVVIILLFVTIVLAIVVERPISGVSWASLLLLQTMEQLSNAVRLPLNQSGPGIHIDRASSAPLRSDHWGER
jgi:hypothetical protein